MVTFEDFDTKELLNEAINNKKLEVISIETKVKRYDTGLPLPRCGTFFTDKEIFRVWYKII